MQRIMLDTQTSAKQDTCLTVNIELATKRVEHRDKERRAGDLVKSLHK